MKELLLKLFKEAQSKLGEGETLNETHLTAISEDIVKSGKLIPEEKYLGMKKELETAKSTITSNEEMMAKFKDVDVEGLQGVKKQLEELQAKNVEDKKSADEATQLKNEADAKATALKEVTSQLTAAGAIDASLVAEKVLNKAGGASKLEYNEDGTLRTDIQFAIESAKQEHKTNFKVVSGSGGGSGAGAGGEITSWDKDTIAQWNEGKSDQERIDHAKENSDYAKAAGLDSYITKEEK